MIKSLEAKFYYLREIVISISISLILLLTYIPYFRFPEPFFGGYDQILLAIFSVALFLCVLRIREINANILDLLVLIFACYTFYREVGISNETLRITQWSYLLPVFFYFLFRSKPYHIAPNFIACSLLCVLIFETISGFSQLFGNTLPNSNTFSITGNFNNPGPFSIFITAILSFFIFFNVRKKKIKLIIYFICLSAFSLTILCFSRTSYISLLLSIIIVLLIYDKSFIWSLLKKSPLLILTVLASLAMVLFILIIWKKDSVLGRMLIYYVNINLVSKNFLFGTGNHYLSLFSIEQARILSQDVPSSFKNNAGESYYTFNEYLRYFAEGGLVKFILFTLIILNIYSVHSRSSKQPVKEGQKFNNQKFSKSLLAAITVILVSALFSYPFHELHISLLFWILTAFLVNAFPIKQVLHIRIKGYSFIVFILFSCIIALIGLINALHTLKSLHTFKTIKTNYLNWEDDCEYYNQISQLKSYQSYNYLYLHSLAGLYIEREEYRNAIKLLDKAMLILPNKEINFMRGNSYKELGHNSLAEKEYTFVSNKLPSLMRPKYLLAKLYFSTGQKQKFLHQSVIILKMSPKIENRATRRMREDIRQLVSFNSEQNEQRKLP